MKFILMMNASRGTFGHDEAGNWAIMSWPKEALKAHGDFMAQLNNELRAKGELVSVAGLAPPAQARLARAGTGGAPKVTDGPFPEAKEFLAGYWIIDVENAERAYAVAARASLAPGPDGKPLNTEIEVRELMFMSCDVAVGEVQR